MNTKNTCYLFFVCLFCIQILQAKTTLRRVEPAFWWAGMKNPELQLLVYGENIAESHVSLNHPGVTLQSVLTVENPNYLFLNLRISPDVKAGKFPIRFQNKKKILNYEYVLKERRKKEGRYRGFNSADVMYLLMPDRFANGDPNNDNITGMNEHVDRKDLYGRHGGDLKGIMEHLDYLQELGITTLWLNPVLENDEPKQSYHGYAITDLYKVDARFGTNEDYIKLADLCREKGIKLIMDMVVNHCGTQHWFIKDLPTKDWIHQFKEFTRSNYRGVTNVDPYRSEKDHLLMVKGWFDTHMADLNQHNPLLANYLIQNSIWWIELVGLDGIRMDTYSYPYKDFMAKWAKAIKEEYPQFSIVGEVWEYMASTQAYWMENNGYYRKNQYESHIASVTDFVLNRAFLKAFNEEEGWDEGISRLYYTLTQDRIYPNPQANLTFLDNHDIPRFYTEMGEDVEKLKLALAALLTLRGVPQLYYGTEILMTGTSHGEVRREFPGGWKDHPKNAFTAEGRTEAQNDIFNYIKTLLQWRKNNEIIHQGKLVHFVPENGVYVYFRYNEKGKVMVVLNNTKESHTLSTKRFEEQIHDCTTAVNVLTKEKITLGNTLEIPPKSALLLDIQK